VLRGPGDAAGVQPTRESGGAYVVSSPSRVRGRSPDRATEYRFLCILSLKKKTNLVTTNLTFFCHLYSACLESFTRLVAPGTGADPENCFGRGTLDMSRRRRRQVATKAGEGIQGVYPLPSRLNGLGSVDRASLAGSGDRKRFLAVTYSTLCAFVHGLVHFGI